MVNSVLIDVDGVQKVQHDMLSLSVRFDNAEPAFVAIADMLREGEEDLFESEGKGTWPALAASTVAQKASQGLDPRILHATKALRESLTERGGDNIEIITDDELVFGSSDPKGRLHQDGTDRMPARPPLQVDEAMQRDVVRELQRYLVGADAAMIGGLL